MTARSRQGSSTATMLLAGVAVSFFFSSLILFLQYMSDFTRSFRMLRWVMGGLETVVSFHDVLGVFPFMAAGCLIVWYLTLDLNLLTTGEEFAFSRGVHVSRTKLLLFFAVSLMVGAVVAVCGPIGFVGLMAPHICRLLVGYDHRWLYPATLVVRRGVPGDLRHGGADADGARRNCRSASSRRCWAARSSSGCCWRGSQDFGPV